MVGIGLKPRPVHLFHDCEPPLPRYLFRAELRSHPLVEDLRPAAGEGAEPRPLQLTERVGNGKTGDPREVVDLHGGERLHVELGGNPFHRPQHLPVECEGEVGVEPADDVDFGRPLRERLTGARLDLPEVVRIRTRLVCCPREGTEGAPVDADVRVVDMAVDVEKDPVAVLPPVDQGGELSYCQEIVALEQKERLVVGDPRAGVHLFRYG